jgi:tetratricopeptide (TPR) repeat protein
MFSSLKSPLRLTSRRGTDVKATSPLAPLDRCLKEPIEKAHALWDNGRWEPATQVLEDALRQIAHLRPFPDKSRLHGDLAAILKDHRPADAIDHSRRAVELAPKDPTTLTLAAWLTYDLGDRRAARAYAARAADATPTRRGFPFEADLLQLRGRLHRDDGDAEGAQRFFEEAFARAPDLIGLAADLAESYLDQGRLEAAAETIAAGLKRQPGNRRLLELHDGMQGQEIP